MANTSQSLITLDFATYKNSLKQYLKNNPVFKDYDYEATNLSVLLDLLAYNTFQTGFYTNMVMGESFIDSAQLRSSIVSHAKDLNYLPVSSKSAMAQVNVVFQASGTSAPYTISKGSPFSTLIKNKSYVFYTAQNIVATYANTVANGAYSTYTFNPSIYEGLYMNDTFVYPASTDIQRFKLTNQDIDTDSIAVTVYENGSQSGTTFMVTDTLLGLSGDSKVFFIQATADGFYEIQFGDNIFGRKPLVNAIINVNYRVTAGSDANGAKLFSCDFDPTGKNELVGSIIATTYTSAQNGSDPESIESVRSYAPRYFATQQRAVSSDDYASLILAKFPSVISDVSVYGGETLNPKRYGYVAVAVKPFSGDVVPDYVKAQIVSTMEKYVAVPNKIILQDPDYFYLSVTSKVDYDPSSTSATYTDILTNVQTAMTTFAQANFQAFSRDFRFSRFLNAVDNADSSIISNDTRIKIIKRITPVLNLATSYTIKFNNVPAYESGMTTAFQDEPVFISSQFSFIDLKNQQIWPTAYLQDDCLGNIAVLSATGSGSIVVNPSIGTIDYTTGTVNIQNLLVSNYVGYISLYLTPQDDDVTIEKNGIILLDLNDTTITLQAEIP